MRKIVLAAVLAAVPLAGLAAAPATAVCDPAFEPLCVNQCHTRLPDPHNPTEYLRRICPA